MKYYFVLFSFFIFQMGLGQTVKVNSKDSLAGYKIQRDREGKLLSWYLPAHPGAGYSHVVKLSSEFIKSGIPIDSKTGLKLYFISCCFDGPHLSGEEKFRQGKTWGNWPNNPATVFAGMVQSLAVDYRVFSGDETYLGVVKEMLDYALKNGTTPADWAWPNVPFASADPGNPVYHGSTKWADNGMIGDGLNGIEPDKVGELGMGYLRFYEITGDAQYLQAALHCADALSNHVTDLTSDASNLSTISVLRSPWPFRVNGKTGEVLDAYCSNVVEPIRLFDELIRIQERIKLHDGRLIKYRQAREIAMKWLFSKGGPMKTFLWNSYFEDIPVDSTRSNRVQTTPLETARYLIKNHEKDPNVVHDVSAILHWVGAAFSEDGKPGIREQTWCYEPMGSHTARYASVCALWFEKTGDPFFKEEAFRNFNYATYMTDANGVVRVGPTWPGSWFSDGYSDYIRHFMEGMAAIPEWAPAGEDHLLQSTSIVQKIDYTATKISFNTFDASSHVVLRLAAKPKRVIVDDRVLSEKKDVINKGWTWTKLETGGVLRISYDNGNRVTILK